MKNYIKYMRVQGLSIKWDCDLQGFKLSARRRKVFWKKKPSRAAEISAFKELEKFNELQTRERVTVQYFAMDFEEHKAEAQQMEYELKLEKEENQSF